jgi:hypothetical protein
VQDASFLLFTDTLHQAVHHFINCIPGWRILFPANKRMAGISCLAHTDVNRNPSQEWNMMLLCDTLTSPGPEKVNLFMAVRAKKSAHILNDP